MTTNSPNPVDGDVQALIAHIKEILQEYEEHGGIGYGEVVYRTALAALKEVPVSITDDMALAFHSATSDSSIGADEVEEIKDGLRAALANVATPPAQLLRPVELPDISAGKYYTEEGAFMAFDYKRDLKAAIRAAGGEVKS